MPTAPQRRERSYAGVAPDVRRDQRRARLIESALDHVGTSGLASLTVGAACTGAGLSKRYFYESFSSVDDLVSAALGQVFQRVADAIEASGLDDSAPPADVLDVAVRSALEAMDDPRAARLYLESAGSPAAAATRDLAVEVLVDQLLGRVAGPGRDDPAARLHGHLLVAGTTHVVALWLRGGTGLDREQLVELLVRIGSDAAAQMRGDDEPPT